MVDAKTLTRPDILYELRRYMDPHQYRMILTWDTEDVRDLLNKYETSKAEAEKN